MGLCQDILNSGNLGYAYHKIIFNQNNLPVDFKLLECNQLFCQLTGLEYEELINNSLALMGDDCKVQSFYRDVFSQRASIEHKSTITLDNKFYCVHMYMKDSTHAITTITNITAEIMAVNNKVIDVCKNIKSNILSINSETGSILFANDDACKFYEYSYNELTTMNINDVTLSHQEMEEKNLSDPMHPFNNTINELIKIAAEHKRSSGFFWQITKSGNIKQVAIDLSCVNLYDRKILFIVIHDKTHVYQMAKQLKENESQYKILFDEAPLGYQALDNNCNFITVNQEWLNMLGYEKHEVIGKSFYDFITDEYKDIFRMNHKKFISNGNINFPFEMRTKENKAIPVEIKGKVKFDELGNFMQCHCILHDLTPIIEAKRKEEALRKTKNEFLAMISHEVRTPLTTILGLNQLLMKTDLDDTQRDYLNKIASAGSSLLGIINDMLDITKYESGKLDIENLPFDFDNFFKNIVTINKMKAEKNGNQFEYEIDETIPKHLVGDALRLGQIINNLLNNAIKFTHMGKITLSARLLGRTKDDADLQIIVRDTGIGMTDAQVKKLFKPFEQADSSFARKYGGSGLGMAISKQLIDLMGGEIKVESIHSEGTIFIINLNFPIDIDNAGQLLPSQSANSTKELLSQLKGKSILVVEDHKINQKIICDILKFYDLNIDVANDGIEALEMVGQYYYDLILMDIQMPKMDGLSAAKQIRCMSDKKTSTTPILAMTAHAMKEEYTKSLQCGMNGHLTKPIDIKALEESLIKYLIKKDITISKHVEENVEENINKNTDNELIDIRIGLLRFHHDADSYKNALNEFLSYKDADKELNKMLKKKHLDKALRYLHSIKGIAANLSINELSKSADKLKKQLSECPSDNGITAFSENLNKTIWAIESKEVFNRIDLVMKKHVKQ